MTVIVVGCGRVGSAVARQLAAAGRHVTVVDPVPEALDRLGPAFGGARMVGSGLHRDVLLDAGIEMADALAAVTGSDAVNGVVARVARATYRVPRVVARLYDPRKAQLQRRLGVFAISPVSWGAQRIADMLLTSHVTPVAGLGGGDVRMVDVPVPHLLIDRPASELALPGEAVVVAITRQGRTRLATGADVLGEDDLVHLAVVSGSVAHLEALIGQREGW